MTILIILNVFSVRNSWDWAPNSICIHVRSFTTPEKYCWLIGVAQLLCFNSCKQIKYSNQCCCYSRLTRRIKSGKAEENKPQFAQHCLLTDTIFRSCDKTFLAFGVFFIHLVCTILLKILVYFNPLQFYTYDCLRFIQQGHKVTC